MTIQADAHYVQQYNSRVTHIYQNKGFLLKGMFMPENKIEGSTAYWPIHGSTVARKKQRHIRASEGNIAKSMRSATLQTWETFDYVGQFDMVRQTVNEKESLQQAGAMALGRAVDQELMDLLNANAPTAGNSFLDTGAAALGIDQVMLLIARFMGNAKIPADGQIYGALNALAWQLLSGFKQFSSSDYVGPDLPFRQRTQAKTWNFVNWVLLPDDYFPVPAANRADLFLWHKPAAGWCDNVGENLRSTFDWDNAYGEWSLRQEAEGAAVCLLPEGLARLRIKTDVSAIALN
ncbi:MAG: phage capsid protein [Cyanobacteriota bacterium]|jgi:hypothetical protein